MSFFAAESSIIIVVFGCIWSAEAGTEAVTGPSIALATASALFSPFAKSIHRLASMMVPTPIVIDIFGTESTYPSKNLEFASIVDRARVVSLVRDRREELDSLKPMCPSTPIPRICRSIPPCLWISSSYQRQK